MIKITKDGKLPTEQKILFNAKCDICGCEFEFGLEDFVKIEKRINGNYTVVCPQCGHEIQAKAEYFNPRIITLDESGFDGSYEESEEGKQKLAEVRDLLKSKTFNYVELNPEVSILTELKSEDVSDDEEVDLN